MIRVDPDLYQLRDGDALPLDQLRQAVFKNTKKGIRAHVNHLAQSDKGTNSLLIVRLRRRLTDFLTHSSISV